MNKYLVYILFFPLLGCAITITTPEEPPTLSRNAFGLQANTKKLAALEEGITRQNVEKVMGESTIVGYEADTKNVGKYIPITIKNPYRIEILPIGRKQYEVVYYLSSVNQADGLVSEEELTPVVFDDNKLIGKGQEFLFKLKVEK